MDAEGQQAARRDEQSVGSEWHGDCCWQVVCTKSLHRSHGEQMIQALAREALAVKDYRADYVHGLFPEYSTPDHPHGLEPRLSAFFY